MNAYCLFVPSGQSTVASYQLYRNPEHSYQERCKNRNENALLVAIMITILLNEAIAFIESERDVGVLQRLARGALEQVVEG